MTDDSDHFIRCPVCGEWIDCRDLGSVIAHEEGCPGPEKSPATFRRPGQVLGS